MDPIKPDFRSVSCPASLDVATYTERLSRLGEVIAENPGGVLVPLLPPFHATVVGKDSKLEETENACRALQDVFRQIPFILELGKIPGLFSERFSTRHDRVKRLTIRILNKDATAFPQILEEQKKLIRQAREKVNPWSDIVDKFIDELNQGRASRDKDISDIDNPVSYFLKISFKRLQTYMTSSNFITRGLIDGVFHYYGRSRPFAKKLIMFNIRNFLMAAVEKSDSGKSFKKEREIFAHMIYEIVDQILLSAEHMMVYRKCLTDIIEKVHGDDVPDEELKKTLLEALECLLEDIGNNPQIMSGAGIGLAQLDDLLIP